MIIEFTVGNFRSFKEMQTLSMVAAPIKSKEKELDSNNIFKVNEKLSLLRSKAIYGANASGKSNVIRAFSEFRKIVLNSVKEDLINGLGGVGWTGVEFFRLNKDSSNQPIFFQIVFLLNNIIYRYGFEIQIASVVSEWLYGIPEKREVCYFERENRNVAVSENNFREAKKFEALSKKGDSEIFRSNSLFLSAVTALGGTLSKSISDFFKDVFIFNGIDERSTLLYEAEVAVQDEKIRSAVADMLNSTDVGIEDIIVEPNSDNIPIPDVLKAAGYKRSPDVKAVLKQYDNNGTFTGTVELDIKQFASEGTKKFFSLSPLLIQALHEGTPIIIDEFDARLHPLLTKKIVSLFNSPETNPKGAQLIFATHDTNLLKPSFLRRDQICFVEKDKYGASHLKTLVEFKGIRNDASYDKDYLQGRYGAVPFLNELDEAVQKSIADEPEH